MRHNDVERALNAYEEAKAQNATIPSQALGSLIALCSGLIAESERRAGKTRTPPHSPDRGPDGGEGSDASPSRAPCASHSPPRSPPPGAADADAMVAEATDMGEAGAGTSNSTLGAVGGTENTQGTSLLSNGLGAGEGGDGGGVGSLSGGGGDGGGGSGQGGADDASGMESPVSGTGHADGSGGGGGGLVGEAAYRAAVLGEPLTDQQLQYQDKAFEIYRHAMESSHIKLEEPAYVSLLRICGARGDFEEGQRLLGEMREVRHPLTCNFHNFSIFHMNCFRRRHAHHVLNPSPPPFSHSFRSSDGSEPTSPS